MVMEGTMLRARLVSRPLKFSLVDHNGDPGPSTVARWRQQYLPITWSRSFTSSSTAMATQRAARGPSGPPRRPDNNRPSTPRSPPRSPRSSRSPSTPSTSTRRPPAKGRIPGYTGALTKRNEPGLRHKDAPSFVLSLQFKEFLRRHPHPMHPRDISTAVQLVRQAPMHLHNAVVWNQMIHLLGREHRMEYMWKTFNDMKKRGITPTTRTYATVLNAFTQIQHDGVQSTFTPERQPSPKQIQRVVDVYNQSQTYISEQVAKVEPGATEFPEIDLAPTNAYLKYLAKYGLWSQIERVRLGLDHKGPLAPDAITYTILFNALLDRMAVAIEKRYSEYDSGDFTRTELGETARAMWDAAQREQVVDEEMALAAIQCLLAGRPGDVELALELIPSLWGIVLPNAQPASMEPKRSTVPKLTLDIRCATTLISILGKNKQTSLAAKYAASFLHNPALRIDYAFLRTAIYGLSAGGDADNILHIFDSYQPPTGALSWPMFIWEDAMVACQHSANFDAALSTLRRMTHLPKIEQGSRKPYVWTPPNGKDLDKQGTRWIYPNSIAPSSKVMAAFVGTALESPYETHKTNTMSAYRILRHFDLETLLTVSSSDMRGRADINLLNPPRPGEFVNPSIIRAAQWPLKLAEYVHSLCNALLKSSNKSEDKLVELRDNMAAIEKTWGPILGAKGSKVAKEDPSPKTARAFFERVKKTPKVEPLKPEKQLSGAKLRRAERRKPLQDGFKLQDRNEVDRNESDSMEEIDFEEIDVDDLEEQVKVEYRGTPTPRAVSPRRIPWAQASVPPTRRGGGGRQLRTRM